MIIFIDFNYTTTQINYLKFTIAVLRETPDAVLSKAPTVVDDERRGAFDLFAFALLMPSPTSSVRGTPVSGTES